MKSVMNINTVMMDKRKESAAKGDAVHNSVMRGIDSQLELETDEKKKKKILRKRSIIKKMKLR